MEKEKILTMITAVLSLVNVIIAIVAKDWHSAIGWLLAIVLCIGKLI